MDEKEIAEIETRAKAAQALLGLDRPLSGASATLSLIAEVRRLRAVLAVYADRDNWIMRSRNGVLFDAWARDDRGFIRAENALKGGE